MGISHRPPRYTVLPHHAHLGKPVQALRAAQIHSSTSVIETQKEPQSLAHTITRSLSPRCCCQASQHVCAVTEPRRLISAPARGEHSALPCSKMQLLTVGRCCSVTLNEVDVFSTRTVLLWVSLSI